MNRRFVGVRDLISQDTCDGPRLFHLEAGLAKAAGVTLVPDSPPSDTSLGSDWRGFVFSCMDASVPDPFEDRSFAAEFCNAAEAVLVELGDASAYEAYRTQGLGVDLGWSSAQRDDFNARFDETFRTNEDVRARFIELRNFGTFD